MIYSRYSQQYAWEIICLQLNGFHTARSRGGQQQARIGIPELVFLPLSSTPPSRLAVSVRLSFWPPYRHMDSLRKLWVLQLVGLKECELRLSWQHRDFQVWHHLPVGKADEVWSQPESCDFPWVSGILGVPGFARDILLLSAVWVLELHFPFSPYCRMRIHRPLAGWETSSQPPDCRWAIWKSSPPSGWRRVNGRLQAFTLPPPVNFSISRFRSVMWYMSRNTFKPRIPNLFLRWRDFAFAKSHKIPVIPHNTSATRCMGFPHIKQFSDTSWMSSHSVRFCTVYLELALDPTG